MDTIAEPKCTFIWNEQNKKVTLTAPKSSTVKIVLLFEEPYVNSQNFNKLIQQINIEAEQQNVESELKKLDELKKRFDQ